MVTSSSSLAVARREPSGLNATPQMVLSSAGRCHAHRRDADLPDADGAPPAAAATSSPSVLAATRVTPPSWARGSPSGRPSELQKRTVPSEPPETSQSSVGTEGKARHRPFVVASARRPPCRRDARRRTTPSASPAAISDRIADARRCGSLRRRRRSWPRCGSAGSRAVPIRRHRPSPHAIRRRHRERAESATARRRSREKDGRRPTSQARRVSSAPRVTSLEPSRESAAPMTAPRWPTHGRRGDLVGRRAPDPHPPVRRAADQPGPSGPNAHTADVLRRCAVRRARRAADPPRRARGRVEQARGAVAARGRERARRRARRRAPRRRCRCARRSGRTGVSPVRRVPRAQLAVTVTGDERLAIGAEGHAQEVHRAGDQRRARAVRGCRRRRGG